MIEPIYHTIGAAIRRKRERAGLTARELGELAGLSGELCEVAIVDNKKVQLSDE